MKYEICEKTLSKARLNKYSQACGQDKSKAIWLYQCNMKLSQRFYGVIGLFEVMLRNAINEHYKQQFGDEDWIVNQCAPYTSQLPCGEENIVAHIPEQGTRGDAA